MIEKLDGLSPFFVTAVGRATVAKELEIDKAAKGGSAIPNLFVSKFDPIPPQA